MALVSGLFVLLLCAVNSYAIVKIDDSKVPPKCKDQATEKLYDVSCEFLLHGLHDLELSPVNPTEGPTDDEEESLSPLDFVKKIRSKWFKKNEKPIPFFPFYPHNENTGELEDMERMLVCNALLGLPGVKTRCCSILEVICPEGVVQHVIDPTGKPREKKGTTAQPVIPTEEQPETPMGLLVKNINNFLKGIIEHGKKK